MTDLHAIEVSIEDIPILDGRGKSHGQLQVVHLRVDEQRVGDL